MSEDVTSHFKQDKQCTHNVTQRRIRVAIVVMKISKYYTFWVGICSLRHPARNVREPSGHSWPTPAIHLSHEWEDFRKKNVEYETCVLIVCTNLPE